MRLVVGAGTSAAQQGTWTTIGTGASDLRVDRSGTGAATLSINGTLVAGSLASGTTAVNNVRLGLVTVAGTTTGVLHLDSFGATN